MNRRSQAVWLLGVTQIVGYGTLYYCFSILAADIAASFAITVVEFFGIFSLSLLAGAIASPLAGRALDRFGATRMMVLGSALCAVAVAVCGLTGNTIIFAAALIAMQVAGCFVFYEAAFAAIVAMSPNEGAKRIVHLTLMAGFASSIFWPLTSWLNDTMGWRNVLLLYAAANVVVCMPIHMVLSRRSRVQESDVAQPTQPDYVTTTLPAHLRGRAMVLVTLGFSLASFALSAVLVQMVPMLLALGFGTAALAVSTLFGPAQVAVRFINLVFGRHQHPLMIAIVALALLPLALFVAATTAPAILGAVAFVVLAGMSSGLKSIVQGTVPLALFGAGRYGARLGFMASFRNALAALAPFIFSFATEFTSASVTAIAFAIIGLLGAGCLIAVQYMIPAPGNPQS